MTYYPVSTPYPIFTDDDGTPLEDGYIYIGEAYQNPITNPITISWDTAGLYPVAQPSRTIGGYPDRNGSPGIIYVNAGAFEDYSILVQDKHGDQIFFEQSARSAFGGFGSNSLDVIDDLRSISGFDQPIYVRGHTTIADGGHGTFEWVDGAAPGTYTDDDGFTIVPTGGDGSGAWVRQIDDFVTVEMGGAINNGDADDSAAINVVLETWKNTGKTVLALGKYLVANTVIFNGEGHSFSMGGNRDLDSNPAHGFIWGGSINDSIVEFQTMRRSNIQSIQVSNTPSLTAGITGIMIRNEDSSVTGANQNVIGTVGIYGCDVGMRVGDYTNDGYDSNFDDNVIENIHFYNVANPLILDSENQDNLLIKRFHNGGPTPVTSGTRTHIIYAKRWGNGFNILDGFSRVEDIPIDGIAINIENGSFGCNYFSLEGSNTCQALSLNGQIARDQCVIGQMVVNGAKDSSDISMYLGGKSGTVLSGCSVPGNIEVARTVTAVNTVFISGYDFVETGSGNVQHIGTRYRTDTATEIIVGSETGILNLTEETVELNYITIYSGQTGHFLATLTHSVATKILDADLSDGNSITIIIDYNVFRTHSSIRNMNACGTFYCCAHADNSGNIEFSTPTAVGQTTALGAEYSAFSISASMTEDEVNNTVSIYFTQTNDQSDNLKCSLYIKVLGNISSTYSAPLANITLA
jgi:hypothetical protein